MRMISYAALTIVALGAALPGMSAAAPGGPPAQMAVQPKPVVQIAILLDTSNSMDGLIEQAKTQLWKIVNQFAKAQSGGVHPDIQVALYQYGTPSLGAQTGYIKQLVGLSDDLDKVSQELFNLRTNGGDEYCGAVIKKAAEELSWSTAKGAYKAIFIAGNEPFTQGSVNYQESCKEAISKGIIVNTIFCGNEQEGIITHWKDGAVLADGAYMSINQDAQVVQIQAPQDKEIAELGSKINTTYLAYGARGGAGAANQMAQDANAAQAGGGRGGAAVERSLAKSTSAYRNSAWDLVDAIGDKRVELKDLKDEDLPEDMRKLDAKGRQDYIAGKQKERGEIQSRIKQLSEDREKYLAQQRKQTGESTLDGAILRAVKDQATKSGMAFPEAPGH